jgi:succinate dehydrogenase/fumarate reductase flavoprotein subunit
MRQENLPNTEIPVTYVHTLVIGSGASGLAAAVRLRAEGVDDVLIVTEGLDKGTSINTGSDKQTYYKLSLYGADEDAPRKMAESYFAGGSMHGDLALVEAALSVRCFMHLVNLGVPFPTDAWGQFVGYKTDHDPRQRATSIGPYTSREMCRALIRRLREQEIPVREGRDVSQLLTLPDGSPQSAGTRIAGALATDPNGQPEVYIAENVVLAVGGPGGLYQTSVYPEVHSGGIGLALMAGATAQSLPESQFGLASIGYRWNVSGTYMQAIPRVFSASAGRGGNGDGPDEREFLRDSFATAGEMNSQLFLKGYQWPFDARKAAGGSSLIDILVYVETALKGRRVYLDYRRNPAGFALGDLAPEAREYLVRSQALLQTPIERLRKMNPGAVELYAEHGIDLARQPLEIAVCAQHNNGGLAGSAWWESTNVAHLFPVGEVNGSHGVYRPGGSALNAGQVGAFRAAEYIAHRYAHWTLSADRAAEAAQAALQAQAEWLARCAQAKVSWQSERDELQARMTRAGAHIRSAETLAGARAEAWAQWARVWREGCAFGAPSLAGAALRTRQLCFAHAVYLDAVAYAVESGVGSRGSAIVLDRGGTPIHERLGGAWRMAPEDPAFRERVLETMLDSTLDAPRLAHAWVPRRPLPETDAWFETAWAEYREGGIYDE